MKGPWILQFRCKMLKNERSMNLDETINESDLSLKTQSLGNWSPYEIPNKALLIFLSFYVLHLFLDILGDLMVINISLKSHTIFKNLDVFSTIIHSFHFPVLD